MKKLTVFIFTLYAATAYSQTAADTAGIKEAALNYVEGFYTGDTARLSKGLIPDLVKRIIDNRGGKSIVSTMGLKELSGYAASGRRMPNPNPAEPFKATIVIYDIASDIAIAKVSTNKMNMFFDYIQVGKINGTWQIINVLWAYNR